MSLFIEASQFFGVPGIADSYEYEQARGWQLAMETSKAELL